MSLILRRIHLYLALFLAPWVLMYAASTFVMNHRVLFHGPEPSGPLVYDVERDFIYPGEMASDAGPQQIALQVLATLEMDGRHVVDRSSTADRVVINRQHPVAPRRITYTASNKHVVIEKMVFSGPGFLERMHRRRGFQYGYVLENLWAASVDLTIAGLFLLAFSGIWMWWTLRAARRLGALALGAGVALFGLFLAVM